MGTKVLQGGRKPDPFIFFQFVINCVFLARKIWPSLLGTSTTTTLVHSRFHLSALDTFGKFQTRFLCMHKIYSKQ